MFKSNVRSARDRGLSNIHIEDHELSPGRIAVDGRLVHNFGDCSYLGIGRDPRLAAGARDAVDRYGTSYSSSIAYTALPLYRDLRDRLELMMGVGVVLAPTTTLAHASALPVIVRPADAVIMDSAVHTSVQMASQLLTASGVEVTTVHHHDFDTLKRTIGEAEARDAAHIWYLIDGVYSMSGEPAPFATLRQLLDEHPTLWSYVDDAHGFGWTGEHGRGLTIAETGWHDRMVVTAGLSKSFAAGGGIIASPDRDLLETIELCGPPLSFGGPIAPAVLGAGVASADLHLSEEIIPLQTSLIERIDATNVTARQVGLPLVSFDRTPIFFAECGSMATMFTLVERMLDDGFFVNGAMWPVVPHGHAGIRFTITNSIPQDVIDAMVGRLAHHFGQVVGSESLTIDLRSGEPVIDVSEPPSS